MERIQAVNITSAYGKQCTLRREPLGRSRTVCWHCGNKRLRKVHAPQHSLRSAKGGQRGNLFDGNKAQGRQPFIQYVGYVPQENNLIPELSVMDNLRLWYSDTGALRQSIEQGFLNMLGIGSMCRMNAGKLSGGMKKRVSIGCALAGNPPVLILDEPDAALDLPGKAEIRRYLGMYKQMGGTILIATHDEADLALCDRIYALNRGAGTELDRSLRGEALLRAIC